MSTLPIKKKKDQSIETLRGLAIILVIAGHVIGNNKTRGLLVEDDSIWRYFYYSLELMRMPLFTVISGYVYSLRPVTRNYQFSFLRAKSRRVLLPMIFVGTIYFLMKTLVPGVNTVTNISEIYRIYFFSFDHFWFLQSIFLVFVLVSIIDSLKFMDSIKHWLLIYLGAVLLFIFTPTRSNLFSVQGFFYLLPFFILGCAINRFEIDKIKKVKYVILPIFLISLTLHQLAWFNIINIDVSRYSVLSISLGTSSILLLFSVRKENNWLSKIGYYAYGIYLFHVFGTASIRIALKMLGIENKTILFFTGLVAGIGIGIILEIILEKNKVTKRLFLGLK